MPPVMTGMRAAISCMTEEAIAMPQNAKMRNQAPCFTRLDSSKRRVAQSTMTP